MKYRLLQLTNTQIGAVAANGYMPLGTITRRVACGNSQCDTFTVTTTGADIVAINETGYYRITYSATLLAGEAGGVTEALIANGAQIVSVSESAAAAGDSVNLTIVYMIRVLPNCQSVANNLPVNIQIQNTGVAITGGTANLIVERVY